MSGVEANDAMGWPFRVELFYEIDADGVGGWIAVHPELPGCVSQGDTPEEALAMLNEARTLLIQVLSEEGRELPRPVVRDYRLDPAEGVEVPFSSSLPEREPSVV